MSHHALTRIRKLRESGRKIMEVTLPDRVLRMVKSNNPDSVRIRFGGGNEFEVGAKELKEAITETMKKRRRGAVRC